MASPNGGAEVGALNVGESNGRKNKDVGGEDGSRLWMKLKFLFCCMALWPKAKGSSGDNSDQDGSRSSNCNRRHQVAQISSTTSNSAIATQSIPNLSVELRAYPHLRNFSYNDLALATRFFKREHFLGEGGFGSVFKGWLSEDGISPIRPGFGIPVAVKTLNQDGLQGHSEWIAEVNYLSQLQHPNLVKLVGFCNEGDKRLLVYEFTPRGSLESNLFRRSVPLPWSTRMKIMLDAAKGLAYLHQDDNKNAVIFRDFKTSNVLLDRDFNAKLSDFGLAKDGPQGDRTHVSTRVMGTLGYAAPEYMMTGHLNAKSDIYSFGVVLLEMITGRRAIDKHRPRGEKNLVKWAVKGKAKLYDMVDPRLQGRYSVKGAIRAMRLAAQCVCHDPSERPEMSEVVQVMKNLPYLANDMAFQAPSPSHAMQVGPSNSNLGANKYGLRIGSSSRDPGLPVSLEQLNQLTSSFSSKT